LHCSQIVKATDIRYGSSKTDSEQHPLV